MSMTAKEAVQAMPSGVSVEAWYASVYENQCRPCVFRRSYAEVAAGGQARELTPEQSEQIRVLIGDGLDEQEAFLAFEPGYVSMSEFHAAWLAGRFVPKTASVEPVVVPEPVVPPVEDVVPEPEVADPEPVEPKVTKKFRR
jgi:hypothetical protein